MKRNIFLILIIYFLIIGTSSAYAEYVFNIYIPEIEDDTKEASSNALGAVINLFQSFEALERGEVERANRLLKNAINLFEGAKTIYDYILSKVPEQPLQLQRMRKELLEVVIKDFKKYELELPGTTRQLALIAPREIYNSIQTINNIKFNKDRVQNRQKMRITIDLINRLTRIGINVSEIGATNKKW